MRDSILLILITGLFANSVLAARVGASTTLASLHEETAKKPTVQERIMEVPPGAMIEVRLSDEQKLKGRLGEVTSEGFSLQTAQGNKIETKKLVFSDVKSFKRAGETTGRGIGKGVVYGLAGIGALMVVLIIWAASRSD